MDEMKYIVYVRVDEHGGIIECNSSLWLTDTAGWVEIDRGWEYPRYPHAQANYFEKPLFTDHGIARYKLVGTTPVERSAEEMAEELASRPTPGPVPTLEELMAEVEKLRAELDEQRTINGELTDAVVELAQLIG